MKFKQYITEKYEVNHMSGKSKIKTDISPEERSFKNLPRDSKKKPKCRFQDWLGIKGNGGQGTDGKYYGWSHRAVYGFGVGDVIKPGSIGNKYDKDGAWDDDRVDFEPYTIKTEKEAKEHAIRFRNDVS